MDNRVALTKLDHVVVSTVDLHKRPEWAIGLDDMLYALGGLVGIKPGEMPVLDAPRLQYETMVFSIEDWECGERLPEKACRRYATLEEAIAGHDEMVEAWKAGE